MIGHLYQRLGVTKYLKILTTHLKILTIHLKILTTHYGKPFPPKAGRVKKSVEKAIFGQERLVSYRVSASVENYSYRV